MSSFSSTNVKAAFKFEKPEAMKDWRRGCSPEMEVKKCVRREGRRKDRQKWKLNPANHLVENVFADVSHRQFVFAIPKHFRPYFRCNREFFTELSRFV